MGRLSAQEKHQLAKWNPVIMLGGLSLPLALGMEPIAYFIKELTGDDRPDDLTKTWYWMGLMAPIIVAAIGLLECCKYAQQTLTPGFMVTTSITKTTVAVASLVLGIAVANAESMYLGLTVFLVIQSLIVIITLAISIYSICVYRRTVNFTGQPLANKAYEFHQRSNSDLESATYDTPKDISSSYRSLASLASLSSKRFSSNTERPVSPGGAAPESEIPRLYGPSSESTGSIESPSISSESVLSSPTTPALPPTPMTPMMVYTHERDTQFDQYMAKRKSQALATPTSPRSPARSTHRRSSASAITSLPILATPDMHDLYNPLTPPTSPGRPVVPIVIISPSRRTSGGLDIVFEEAEGKAEEPEVITRPRKDSMNTRRTRQEIHAAEEVGLLREVDLDDGNTSKKRSWDGETRA